MMQTQLIYIFGSKEVKILKEVERKLELTYSRMPDSVKGLIPKKVYSIYYLYPLLFKDSFCVDYGMISDMCLLSILSLESCLFDDKILDGQETISGDRLHMHNIINVEIGRLVQKLIGDDDTFWKYYYKYYNEYAESTMLERQKHFGRIEDYSFEEFVRISKGKQAMCKIIPAVFCCIQNDFTMLDDYEKSIDLNSVGMQIFDDLRDWRDDFSNQRYSYMLSQILYKGGFTASSDIHQIIEYLFERNLDTYYLDHAKIFLDEAMVCSKHPMSSVWCRNLRYSQNYVNKLRADLLKIRECPPKALDYWYRREGREDTVSVMENLKQTLDFIDCQYRKNVGDVKEWMITESKEQPGEFDVLGGDIFMRSQMFNLLSDVAYIDRNKITAILNREKDYILSVKSKIYKYGWTYVEGLYGNCPDLDTFSELLRVSHSQYIGSEELKLMTDTILSKVLKSNHQAYFSTWIIDEDEPDYNFIMKNFTMMGEIEVTSNFLKSLYQLDYLHYKKKIEEGLAWIAGVQNKEGFWDSSWYIGNYYCGYVLSSLSRVSSFTDCYQRFLEYLYLTQNENGSWGDGEGNPLDTAYALLSIVNVTDIQSEKEKRAVDRGTSYLLQTRNLKGYWYSCEFIKMGKGKEDIAFQNLRYRSVTLTTVYCFVALVKVYGKREK